MTRTLACNHHRGVALLEALVALVVMAIGAVALVGLQASLRFNGDVSKQRSEAVRLAQEKIETWRGFTVIPSVAGRVDWVDIASAADDVTPTAGNATYTRDVTVLPGGAGDDPLWKTVHVVVRWNDRTGQQQRVALNTVIAGVSPELGGTLSTPSDRSLIKNPSGRYSAIPRSAVDQGDGTSKFTPPGAGTAFWVFDNTTGTILQVCPPAPAACGSSKAVLLSGFIRFSTGVAQPTAADAANPASTAIAAAQVMVDENVPIDQDVACYHDVAALHTEYFCAVPINVIDSRWSGQSRITGLTLSSSVADSTDSAYRGCRYTPVPDNTKVVPTDMTNEQHPLNYVSAGAPLVNQNFLIIKGGFAGVAFSCPSTTWHHQPAS